MKSSPRLLFTDEFKLENIGIKLLSHRSPIGKTYHEFNSRPTQHLYAFSV